MKKRARYVTFVISALLSAFLLGFFQFVVWGMNIEIQNRNAERQEFQTDIYWNIIENIIKESSKKSEDTLNKEILPGILNDIKKEYPDQKSLKDDLDRLSDVGYDNPIVTIFANHIRGKYLDNVQTDSNDVFVLMKSIGVVSDLSISTSSAEAPRTISREIESHYNKKLAEEAYTIILNQIYQKRPIFWERYAPDITNDDPYQSEMKLSYLKNVFYASGGDIESLRPYTFLVPEYIFVDRDILGNPIINDRGIRQANYQFVLVQEYNVTELIENNSLVKSIFDLTSSKETQQKVWEMNIYFKVLLFFGLVIVIYFVRTAVKVREEIAQSEK